MITFHWYIIFVAALIPMVIGFIWYNPKVFGNAWMRLSNTPPPEQGKGPNMVLMMLVCYILSVLVAFALISITIHQFSVFGVLQNEEGMKDPNSEIMQWINGFMQKYGTNFRTFKHGAFHGALAGFMIAMPVIATSAIFERRGFKYVAITAGYWIVAMSLMGGLICACL